METRTPEYQEKKGKKPYVKILFDKRGYDGNKPVKPTYPDDDPKEPKTPCKEYVPIKINKNALELKVK